MTHPMSRHRRRLKARAFRWAATKQAQNALTDVYMPGEKYGLIYGKPGPQPKGILA